MVIAEAAAEDMDEVRGLFRAYAEWLAVDLCFQSFEAELATLPGAYAAPKGRLLLAKAPDGNLLGCVALRHLAGDVCEMKRLWVAPEAKGRGIGNSLGDAIVKAGRELGYARMRLDTILARMPAAQAIYSRLGFRPIAPYYDNPLDGVVIYEAKL